MQMKESYADTVTSNLQSFSCELYTQRKDVLCFCFSADALTETCPYIHIDNLISC